MQRCCAARLSSNNRRNIRSRPARSASTTSAVIASTMVCSRAASQMGRYGMRVIEVQQGPDDLKRLAELYADDAKKE